MYGLSFLEYGKPYICISETIKENLREYIKWLLEKKKKKKKLIAPN